MPLNYQRLKALTFDVTNTLIKARCSIGHQYADAASAHGIAANPAALERVFEPTMAQKKHEQPDYGMHDGVTSREWWADVVKRVFINAGHNDASPAALVKVSDTLWEHFQEEPEDAWEVMPNVHEGLEALRAQGLRLGIVSNFDATLEATLRAHSLHAYFDFAVTSEQLGVSKPKPGIFEKALGDFEGGRLEPTAVGHVGDEIKNDYVGPRNLRMHAFLVDNDGLTSNALMQRIVDRRHIVRDLKGLSNLLATSHE
jgi:REG-2-like HAD superfamily hydrolase